MIVPRLCLMRELLADKGSIYVHLDWHIGHYVKIAMDEIFGKDNFVNQITWQRTNAHNMNAKYFMRVHDVIYFYGKENGYVWNTQFLEYSPEQLKRYKPDAQGRLYTGQDLTITAAAKTRNFEWRGSQPPSNRGWALSLEKLEELWSQGKNSHKRKRLPST